MSKVAHFEAEMFKRRLSKELDEIVDPVKKFGRAKIHMGFPTWGGHL